MSNNSNFVDPPEDGGEFVVDSPKGAVVDKNTAGGGGSGRSYNDDRTHEPPKDQFEKNRLLYDTDPHVGHSVDVSLDWLLADGYNISERHIPGSEKQMDIKDLARFRTLIANSNFDKVFNHWIENGAIEGHGFMELVVEDGSFKPRILPGKKIYKFTDEYGQVQEYILEPPEGGTPTDDDATKYKPSDVAEFYFRRNPLDEFGRSLIERVKEQANILRDMEIDYARFVASKAYPPIFWKCGTGDEDWSEPQIDNWLDQVTEIEPDSMIAGHADVEAEVVGTTSTSSSAGAMRLEETFRHHERRIVTGIGVPAVLANMDNKGGSAEILMPGFKRRIRRYQNLIKEFVEEQIFRPLYVEVVKGQSLEDYDGLIPEFEFGEHSSAEDRLEIDKLLKLFNTGFLTREAFAERAGIDPETEMPSMDGLNENILPVLQSLANEGQNLGDAIQSPEGGRPTDNGGGTQSAGREVTSREDSSTDNSDDEDRRRKSPTEDEDV